VQVAVELVYEGDALLRL